MKEVTRDPQRAEAPDSEVRAGPMRPQRRSRTSSFAGASRAWAEPSALPPPQPVELKPRHGSHCPECPVLHPLGSTRRRRRSPPSSVPTGRCLAGSGPQVSVALGGGVSARQLSPRAHPSPSRVCPPPRPTPYVSYELGWWEGVPSLASRVSVPPGDQGPLPRGGEGGCWQRRGKVADPAPQQGRLQPVGLTSCSAPQDHPARLGLQPGRVQDACGHSPHRQGPLTGTPAQHRSPGPGSRPCIRETDFWGHPAPAGLLPLPPSAQEAMKILSPGQAPPGHPPDSGTTWGCTGPFLPAPARTLRGRGVGASSGSAWRRGIQR